MLPSNFINDLPLNKVEISTFIARAKKVIMSGNENPLLIAKKLKVMETIVSELRKDKDIDDVMITEAMKYPKKTFEAFDAKFQLKETGVGYLYENCNDKVWDELDYEIQRLTKAKKAREEMLKTGFNAETGEEFKPPLKTSTTKVTISLK